MRWLLLVLSACGASPSKPAQPDDPVRDLRTPASAQAHCPLLSTAVVGYWAKELFPSCQEPPFEQGLTLCNGEVCDKPCGRTLTTSTRNGTDTLTWTFQYEDGKYTGSTRDGKVEESCVYEKGKRQSCKVRDQAWRVERNDDGLIASVFVNEKRQIIRYDSQGRTSSVGGLDATYDHTGRLTNLGALALGWDDRGRVARVTERDNEIAFDYDAEGRVIRLKIEPLNSDESTPPRFIAIIYDGKRVKEMRSTQMEDTNITKFDYDCP